MMTRYTRVPSVCSGVILGLIEDQSPSYDVQITKSPLGEFNGAITCAAIYSPGSDGYYKKGESVKVLITFMYGGLDDKVKDVAPGMDAIILGKFDEERIINKLPENPSLKELEETTRFINPKSLAGFSASDNGEVVISTSSAVYEYLSPGGFGDNKDSKRSYAQNFHTILSDNAPLETARIHFGMNNANSSEDESTRMMPEMNSISYRKFIPQSQSLENWVSTCEGTYSPFFGPNNIDGQVTKSKDTLYYKGINADKKRITIEGGEPGDSFFTVRVDNIIANEMHTGTGSGVTTAIAGNLFKFKVGDDGAFEIRGGGKGMPGTNFNGVSIIGTADGELKINASKGVTISTGDTDEAINSIKISDSKVEVAGVGGFEVNGEEVLYKRFVDWFTQNAATLFIAPPSGPCTPGPGIALMAAQQKLPTVGFPTAGVPIVAPGLIVDPDPFVTA